MNWLHTWTGVVLGGLLFAISWMGTLSAFDQEIDLWMKPVTRFAEVQPTSVDALEREISPMVKGALSWSIILPDDRSSATRIGFRKPGEEFVTLLVDPAGKLLADPGTWAGSRSALASIVHKPTAPWRPLVEVRFKTAGLAMHANLRRK